MNAALQESRKLYWRKVHAIQAERGCTPAEAKKLYKQNGVAATTAQEITPDSLVALAIQKATQLETAIDECQQKMQSLRADLARWSKIGRALDESETETIGDSAVALTP